MLRRTIIALLAISATAALAITYTGPAPSIELTSAHLSAQEIEEVLVAGADPTGTDPTQLTPAGIRGLGQCETSDRGLDPNYEATYGLGLFHGAHQWLPATWRAAATHAGLPEWADAFTEPLRPVPQAIQDQVVASHWANSIPSTQWPRCYDDALRAMGFSAPCLPRNVIDCATVTLRPEQGAETNPPSPPPISVTG